METEINWGRVRKALFQEARERRIDATMVEPAIDVLRGLVVRCGPFTHGRKLLQRIGNVLITGNIKILAPACPDYSSADGKYTFCSVGGGVSLLTQRHISFLQKISEILPAAEIVIAIADQEADDSALCQAIGKNSTEFSALIASTIEETRREVAKFGWQAKAMTAIIPTLVSQEQRLVASLRSDRRAAARLAADTLARSEMYLKIGQFSAAEMQERTIRTAAQYLALGNWARANGFLVANHTTTNLAWYLMTGVGVLHNPIKVY